MAKARRPGDNSGWMIGMAILVVLALNGGLDTNGEASGPIDTPTEAVTTPATAEPDADATPDEAPTTQEPQPDPTDTATPEPEPSDAPTVDPTDATTLAEVDLATVLDPTAVGMGVITDAEQRDRAVQLIGRVPIAEPVAETDYDRDAFGQSWADVDRNGCDTRNDTLARDLVGETFRDNTNDCVVITGTMVGPYTGRRIEFVKADAHEVHIDHVVSLSAAWRMGASGWDDDTRLAFANDPLNLLASDGGTNSSKSDDTPSQWTPPHGPSACSFAARYAAVSITYSLPVTPADSEAMLSACA